MEHNTMKMTVFVYLVEIIVQQTILLHLTLI